MFKTLSGQSEDAALRHQRRELGIRQPARVETDLA
jgi:hypothetical protein